MNVWSSTSIRLFNARYKCCITGCSNSSSRFVCGDASMRRWQYLLAATMTMLSKNSAERQARAVRRFVPSLANIMAVSALSYFCIRLTATQPSLPKTQKIYLQYLLLSAVAAARSMLGPRLQPGFPRRHFLSLSQPFRKPRSNGLARERRSHQHDHDVDDPFLLFRSTLVLCSVSLFFFFLCAFLLVCIRY